VRRHLSICRVVAERGEKELGESHGRKDSGAGRGSAGRLASAAPSRRYREAYGATVPSRSARVIARFEVAGAIDAAGNAAEAMERMYHKAN